MEKTLTIIVVSHGLRLYCHWSTIFSISQTWGMVMHGEYTLYVAQVEVQGAVDGGGVQRPAGYHPWEIRVLYQFIPVYTSFYTSLNRFYTSLYLFVALIMLHRRRSSERLMAEESRGLLDTIHEKYIQTHHLATANRDNMYMATITEQG